MGRDDGPRRAEPGFSLVENVFSAMVIAVVILGMSTVISTYSVSQQKTKDRPFALNLAQQQLDEVMMKLVTQNAMVFDNAPTPRGRSYYLKTENLTVSAYFFNNFPWNAWADPVAKGQEMGAIPWESDTRKLDRRPVPTDIQDKVYSGAVAPDNIPFIRYTNFYRNRFYTGGGIRVPSDNPAESWDLTQAKAEMGTDSPPKYVVRLQLFGVPDSMAGTPAYNMGDVVRSSERLKAADYPNDPRTPPAASPFLIGDSCIAGPSLLGGATGRMYLRERTVEGADDPTYFPHFTSKVYVARVYRIEDFIDDGTFYKGTGNPDTEIASASVVLVGRVQRK